MIKVSIVKGHYRNRPVAGVFELVKEYTLGARGGFVTIRNPTPEPKDPPVQRILVEKGNFTMLNEAGEELADHIVVAIGEKGGPIQATANYEEAFTRTETDDEAMERICDTFLMQDKIVDASAKGIIRGLVISGPPGIGKSFGVEKQLTASNMLRIANGHDPKFEVISGGVSSIGLYQKLYHNSDPEDVLVLDDCDGVLSEEECMLLLKAALNSGDKRRICWSKESRVLGVEGIPEAFDFQGSIIFLTNVDFEATIARGSKISAHLAAVLSRCHYMDLEMSSMRDRLLRIKQVVRDGMLTPFAFTQSQEDDIVSFIVNNSEHLREVSLRMTKKLADLVKMDPTDWYETAEATLLVKEAKFKRLLARRQEALKHDLVLAEV